MTPLRALMAGIIAAILWSAGLFIATGFAGGRPHDLVPLLSVGRDPFELFCFLAAWGALIAGALGVIAAFLAFIAPEEEDDPRFRRRGFPKAAPLVLIALSLALAWFALQCAGATTDETPFAVSLAPEDKATPIAEPMPVEEPIIEETVEPETFIGPSAPLKPAPVADAAQYQWTYKIPLVRYPSVQRYRLDGLLTDDAENSRLLCAKAWVAVTGSSSEEGPPDRNIERARMRAVAAALNARSWLANHSECGATPVFAVSLGQHAYLLGESENGAASAYQRQVLTVSRTRMEGETALSPSDAETELRAFLADPQNLAALYAGRRFPSVPEILP